MTKARENLRERMHAEVHAYKDGESILVTLRDDLTDPSYDLWLAKMIAGSQSPAYTGACNIVTGTSFRPLQSFGEPQLRKAGILYSRIYDLRSTYAARLSAGGVADEWVVQLLRQGNSDVLRKYLQMKVNHETGSPGEAQPPSQRNDPWPGASSPCRRGFWYSDERKTKERILESTEMF
jgi:hypothetical protein